MTKDFDIDKFLRVTLGLRDAHLKWNAKDHPRNPDGTFAKKFKLLVHEARRNPFTQLPEDFLTVPDKVNWGLTLEKGYDEYDAAREDSDKSYISYLRKDPFSAKMMQDRDEEEQRDYPSLYKPYVDKWAHLSAEDTLKFSKKRKADARVLYADLMHKYIRNIDLSNLPKTFEEHFHKIVERSKKYPDNPTTLEDALQEAYRESSGNTRESLRYARKKGKK